MQIDEQEIQLSFDFFTDGGVVPGGQIAAPEDDSLLPDSPDDDGDPVQDDTPSALFDPFRDEQENEPEQSGENLSSSTPDDTLQDESREQDQAEVISPLRPRRSGYSQKDIRRAALAWLAAQHPTAAALKVPTRLTKFRADAAAFWSTPRKQRLLSPERTVLIETRLTRSECWPECSGREELLAEMRNVQERKLALEEKIRRTEPHLRDSDVLFPEIEYWDYDATADPDYKLCTRKLRECEHSLYAGTRFERIRNANVANELYLAVPEGVIHPHELAAGWGLLYIGKRLSVTLVKPAEQHDVPKENMLHISQNIAASSLQDVLFANGLRLDPNGSAVFMRLPRRRARMTF